MEKVTESKHKDYPSIYRKIQVSLGFMVLTMFSIFWSTIYLAEDQMEVISLYHWLDTEATRYVSQYAQFGENTPLPHEDEFSTYWSEKSLPDWLASYQKLGFYEHLLGTEDKHFLVFNHPSGKGLMYIVFQDDADDYLDEYEGTLHNYSFLLGGLISVLVAIYGIYVVRSLSHPLNKLEEKISKVPPNQPTFEVDTNYAETRHIEQTLLDSKNHISSFFQREKDFSRFASHELRTPIMVIKGSADLLAKIPNQPPIALKAINRLQQASEQMRILTEAFLLLGKETIEHNYFTDCCLEAELQNQLEEMTPLLKKQDFTYKLKINNAATISAPKNFITIVINNLIKNAFSYSIGDVDIRLNCALLTITNCHDENETYNAGYGCGLIIVQKICERMDWEFEVQDNGTTFKATLRFTPKST